MQTIKQVKPSEVFNHWEKVENISIGQRADIVLPLVAYTDLLWSLVEIEKEDLDKLYVISSDDWKADGLCMPDFKLMTAIKNYEKSADSQGKYTNIKEKEELFKSNPNSLDTKLILVSENQNGPYSIIEGNKRAVALGKLQRLIGLTVYLGISAAIRGYIWSRHIYK